MSRKESLYPNPNNKPKGYSPGTHVGLMVFTSGQVAEDAWGNLVGKDDVAAQARQCFKNIQTVLALAGAQMSDIAKITCFLTRTEHVLAYAGVRAEWFPANGPASSTVIVTALVSPDYLVEIEAIGTISG